MLGSGSSTCQKLIVISTAISKNNSTHHLLTMKAVLHFKWVSCCLQLKKMKSNGAAGPKNIPSSFLKSIGPCSLAHCPQIWTATNIIPLLKTWKSPGLVKLHLSTLSVSNPVLSNFWKKLLPIIFTTLWRRKICSADSELGFIKVQAAKIRSLVKSKQQ